MKKKLYYLNVDINERIKNVRILYFYVKLSNNLFSLSNKFQYYTYN